MSEKRIARDKAHQAAQRLLAGVADTITSMEYEGLFCLYFGEIFQAITDAFTAAEHERRALRPLDPPDVN